MVFKNTDFFLEYSSQETVRVIFQIHSLEEIQPTEIHWKIAFLISVHNRNDSNANILHLESTFLPRTLEFLLLNLPSLILYEDGITNYFYFYFAAG